MKHLEPLLPEEKYKAFLAGILVLVVLGFDPKRSKMRSIKAVFDAASVRS
jgi:hypothetical protein